MSLSIRSTCSFAPPCSGPYNAAVAAAAAADGSARDLPATRRARDPALTASLRPGGACLPPRRRPRDPQVGHIAGRHPAGKLLDRRAWVAQDALITGDVGDRPPAAWRVHKGWGVGAQPEVVIG